MKGGGVCAPCPGFLPPGRGASILLWGPGRGSEEGTPLQTALLERWRGSPTRSSFLALILEELIPTLP